MNPLLHIMQKIFVTPFGTNRKCDHSRFIYKNGKDMTYILLYVDDIILTTSSDALRLHFTTLLAKEFAMNDLGPLSYFLGVAVKRYNDHLFLSQEQYAVEILDRADMTNCNPAVTPVDTNSKPSSTAGSPVTDPNTF
ncbi:hypothetical protein OSB04_un001484 [Centaurea solstitialis]|uniref:Reverse transcriptase Ty1/copia-type domain-containing protein n=1 Tax=Centaurea solstitialis TaxID=347529 RepID=A0AA38VQU8_9ASTR|nr:hypothetical protein OSB04_un001484 [Centaurea solstitialis]